MPKISLGPAFKRSFLPIGDTFDSSNKLCEKVSNEYITPSSHKDKK